MNNKIKQKLFETLANTSRIDSRILRSRFGKKTFTNESFDNVVMRYVRTMREKGYLKRVVRGTYVVTLKGNKFIAKSM